MAQRYSGGLAVPKYQLDTFTGITSGAVGEITLVLKYEPTSIENILIETGWLTPGLIPRFYDKASLTGSSLGLLAKKLQSPGGGADCGVALATNETQGTISVHYKVG